MKQLFFTDLDKTLLNNKHEISINNLEAIHKLLAHDIEVVFTSGRSYRDIKEHYLIPYHLNIPVIALNGALIYSKEGHLIQSLSIDHHEILSIINDCSSNRCFCLLYDESHTYNIPIDNTIEQLYLLGKEKSDDINTILIGMQVFYDLVCERDKISDDIIDEFVSGQRELYKIEIVSHDKKTLNMIKDKINTRLEVSSSHPSNLEINHPQANKGNAIKVLSDYYYIDISNTIAIGDGLNDYSMLSTAGYGIAMGNAVNELKTIADVITDDYDQDGFYHAVNRLFHNE